ncbi:hypothetical protein GUITHDRAFT_108705 [Guillardia theta CCMP2712]|uniref:Uncharacterized protein n=1 Tax=Guillardia theta (strain CCMP2712) TaxID=905079 RepID=L1JAV1_GUITC|nr:hypothetical protein GUITHDRAFT_108705 [Guillardia theta CCMP2712]EKX45437.1 hypothetical protein GUITHDRAFT_108705 [Guillardia theta CCMP2712]|eukprot:XP_005832417.1 hypothetical protein GUITHDRAFT_108705 [Guillardia theta CCMP2712]
MDKERQKEHLKGRKRREVHGSPWHLGQYMATWTAPEEKEKNENEKKRRRLCSCKRQNRTFFVVMSFGILFLLTLLHLMLPPLGEDRVKLVWQPALDASVLNRTKQEFLVFKENQSLPTFGITGGRYDKKTGKKSDCNTRLVKFCNGMCSKHGSSPPEELKSPGLLQLRGNLSEDSQCFLWYTNAIWTRPTAGRAGLMLSRLGAGVDNKAYFAQAVSEYVERNGCKYFQFTPPTLDLGEQHGCFAFFYNNARYATSPQALWFLKKSKGSTGCPRSGGLASLEVPDMWTIKGHKFDHRIYVLVPSMEPWTIFFRPGHLRFSVFNHTNATRTRAKKLVFLNDSDNSAAETDPYLATHVTNPRFGLAHTNKSQEVLRPVETLRSALEEELGVTRGRQAWRKLSLSVRNAALSAIFSVRYRSWGQNSPWGYLFMAMDVAYDRHQNAFVLDLNSGPSFYHGSEWPEWYVQDRSAMIREAADIIQELAFRKLVSQQETSLNPLNLTAMPLKTAKSWEMLFAEGGGWRHEGRDGLIKEGGCVSLSYQDAQPRQRQKQVEELKVRSLPAEILCSSFCRN